MVCACETSGHRDNTFVRETPSKTTIDGAYRRELNEVKVLLVSGIYGGSDRMG